MRRIPRTPEQRNALISNIIESFSDDIDNDPKSKQIVDLVKGIGEVYEKVTERKAWALQKVAQSETMLGNDYLELQELRMAKAKRGETKYKRDHLEKSQVVKIKEEYVQHAYCDANAITDTARRLELQNAQIRAETLAYKQISSKSEMQLRKMLKREKKCMTKLGDMKNQTSASKRQYEKELLWAEWMQQELVKVKKEAEEIEMEWKQEIQVKERMLALVAEETRLARTQKASSRDNLSKLRQQVRMSAKDLRMST